MTGGVCAATNEGVMCITQWGSAGLTCVTVSASGGVVPFTGGNIYIGDPDYVTWIVVIRNVRLYSSPCFDTTEANSLYVSIKDYCMDGCVHCIAPDKCDLCDYGYYLDSDGVCERCHSCCNGCTGTGYNNCLSCAHACALIDTNTCARKSDR